MNYVVLQMCSLLTFCNFITITIPVGYDTRQGTEKIETVFGSKRVVEPNTGWTHRRFRVTDLNNLAACIQKVGQYILHSIQVGKWPVFIN